MRLTLMVISFLMFSPVASDAHDACPKPKCEETKQKIKKIQSIMRQGYTRAQGEKMEAKLRTLRAIRSKRCR